MVYAHVMVKSSIDPVRPVLPVHAGLLCAAAGLGLLGVLAGTFGAHGLKSRLTPDMLAIFEAGVRYHLIHAVALLAIAVLAALTPQSRLVRASGGCMVIGIAIFSGSLYALALTGQTKLGMITPFGGASFMLGWLLLVIWALRDRTRAGRPA